MAITYNKTSPYANTNTFAFFLDIADIPAIPYDPNDVQYQIDAMTISGGLMLVGIGLRLLNIKKISVANLLPALVIAPVLATVLHSI